jgi:hypothetical protein
MQPANCIGHVVLLTPLLLLLLRYCCIQAVHETLPEAPEVSEHDLQHAAAAAAAVELAAEQQETHPGWLTRLARSLM